MQEEEKEEVVSSFTGETICAQATSHVGTGAVAIIRLSGPEAFSITEKFARKIDGRTCLALKGSHRCRYGLFCDSSGVAVDSVLYVYMRGPNSFTGEDVVEIQCHGGVIQPRQIIEVLISGGARLARCGEFSQRAFLNGRLSLMEAEAIQHIVSATTRAGAQAALNNSLGLSTSFVDETRKNVLSLLARIEVQIDFPEDVEHLEDNTEDLINEVEDVLVSLERYLNSFDRGILLKNGLSLVITGPANSGKSSLFNCLVKSDRAIVNSIAGTTRDTISESVSIDGWNFNIFDTAGLRDTSCTIEQEGIRRSMSAVESADIVVRLYDASLEHEKSIPLMNLSREKTGNVIRIDVGNKLDLIHDATIKDPNHMYLSALTGEGIDTLLTRLVSIAEELCKVNDSEGIVMASLRQKNDTMVAVEHLREAADALKMSSIDQAADDLRYAGRALSSLLGHIHSDEVVDEIFAGFCLGK